MRLIDFVLGVILGYKLTRRRPPKPIPKHLLN